jgi:uncharacterized protein (DUF1810 family)
VLGEFVAGVFTRIIPEVFAESDEKKLCQSVQHTFSCNREMSVCRHLIFPICLASNG